MALMGHERTGPAPMILVLGAVVVGPSVGWLLFQGLDGATIDLLGGWSGPLWLTLRISLLAIVIAGVAGIAAGYGLAKSRFPGRDLIEAIASVPMILPPTVLGYYVLTGMSPDTRLGSLATSVFGQPPIFNVTGCVLVGAITAFPFCMRSTRAAVEAVDLRSEQVARTAGLPEWRIALQVTLPLGRRGIAVGLTLGYLRALGEYGATLLVGGAIRGETRTLSIAVLDEPTWERTQADLKVMVVMAVLALGALAFFQRVPE